MRQPSQTVRFIFNSNQIKQIFVISIHYSRSDQTRPDQIGKLPITLYKNYHLGVSCLILKWESVSFEPCRLLPVLVTQFTFGIPLNCVRYDFQTLYSRTCNAFMSHDTRLYFSYREAIRKYHVEIWPNLLATRKNGLSLLEMKTTVVAQVSVGTRRDLLPMASRSSAVDSGC